MKVHFVNAIIERDPMEKIPVCVPATALPILQLVHGGKVSDIRIKDDFKEVDPDQEYDRLEALYGERKGTGRSFAEEVYGSAHGMMRRMSIGDERLGAAQVVVNDDGNDAGDESVTFTSVAVDDDVLPDDPPEDPASLFGGDAGNEEHPAASARGRRK